MQILAGDLSSIKSTVHGQLGEVEEVVSSMRLAQTEIKERQKSLKAEIHQNSVPVM